MVVTMNKLALQAALCYNRTNDLCVTGVLGTLPVTLVTSILRRRLATMNTLPHHAQDGNSSFVTIPLTKGKVTIIDAVDADLARLRWHYGSTMARRTLSNRRGREAMHRVIMERKLGRPIQPGMEVDHRNGDSLDNRRANLRETTPQQNRQNRKVSSLSTSGYKGVIYDKHSSKPWLARIWANGKRLNLGGFATPLEAARAYDRAAIKYHGEYARTNFPIEEIESWSHERTLRAGNTTGYRGIELRESNRWQARIKAHGQRINLGTFATPEEAARVYDKAALRAYGESASLNFPKEDYEHFGGFDE